MCWGGGEWGETSERGGNGVREESVACENGKSGV